MSGGKSLNDITITITSVNASRWWYIAVLVLQVQALQVAEIIQQLLVTMIPTGADFRI